MADRHKKQWSHSLCVSPCQDSGSLRGSLKCHCKAKTTSHDNLFSLLEVLMIEQNRPGLPTLKSEPVTNGLGRPGNEANRHVNKGAFIQGGRLFKDILVHRTAALVPVNLLTCNERMKQDCIHTYQCYVPIVATHEAP